MKDSFPLLDNLGAIYTAARQADDGECCMVAPSPELNDAIKVELSRLRKRDLGPMIKVQDREAAGLNDGLIYPGDMFPVGTPLRIARRAAAERVAPCAARCALLSCWPISATNLWWQTRKHFEDLFFSTGVIPTGSVREYFREVTNGLIDIQGEVVGPLSPCRKTMANYANGASGTGDCPRMPAPWRGMPPCWPTRTSTSRPYDNDGDGFVDAFIVIHAGPGGEVDRQQE